MLSLLVALLIPGMVGDPLEEALVTFKEQFRKHRADANLRVADVRDVATELTYARKPKPEGLGYDVARMARLEMLVVQALTDAIEDSDFHVRQAAVEAIGTIRNADVSALLVTTYLTPPKSSGKVPKKTGLASAIEMLGLMGSKGSIPQIQALLISDQDFDIRYACLKALGSLHAKEATPAIVPFLESDQAALKAAAIDALSQIGDPSTGLPLLVKALEDPEWQVRSSAIHALGLFRDKSSIATLIDRMEKEEGRLKDDAHDALMTITGEEFPPNLVQWKSWWATVQSRWQVPTLEQIAEKKKKRSGTYAAKIEGQSEFMDVKTQSKRIVFVVDVSGSMEDLVADRAAFKLQDRGYQSFQKMEIVKEELLRTLASLKPEVRFNIISFASEAERWRESLVPATELNKAGAMDYVRKLKPIGGASQGFRARAGLSASAGLDKGKTNTYIGLITGLDAKPASWEATHPRTSGGLEKEFNSPVDTVFFLSDGEPTVGEFIQTEDIRAEIRRVNELRKVVIHCIAIGNFQKGFMEALAKENNGLFVDLSPNPGQPDASAPAPAAPPAKPSGGGGG